MTDIAEGSQFEKKDEVAGDPKRVAKRWSVELRLASKREEKWRKEAKEVISRYKLKDKKKGSYNILWSNTETMRPTIYSSLPVPDVRRRFRDADPLGKAVSEVLGRSLDFMVDSTNFDSVCKAGALSMLLPGRSVAWVRYVPSFAEQPTAPDQAAQPLAGQADPMAAQPPTNPAADQNTDPTVEEVLEWEQSEAEHVKWDDFRHGAGDTWEEVTWVGRRHRMTRDAMIEKFGEKIGNDITLDSADSEEVKKLDDNKVKELFRTASVWEIWDKDNRQVLFIAENYDKGPAKITPDPLRLKGFFPCAEPLLVIEDVDSLIPQTHYSMYEEQAKELDEVTKRINDLIKSIKASGIYDARIAELVKMMESNESQLVPAEDIAGLLAAMGGKGIEALIWMQPIDMYVKVYAELIQQREALKQTIYEITGLSDILRGMSNAAETATAQQIKNKWGTLRVQRMQRAFQRWVRDTIRLMAEVISQRFQVETFQKMTGLKYPTLDERNAAQQLIMQAQQQEQMQQMPMPGMPPMPMAAPIDPAQLDQAKEIANKVAWEEIVDVLRSDPSREFRIDIETDSTIAETIETDMAGLRDVMGGIVEIINGFAPAVQAGAVPVESVKELILAVTRRARLGMAVEDAFDKMQAPQQQDQSQAAQMQMEHEMKVADFQQKAEIHKANKKAETDIQAAEIKAKADIQIEEKRAQHKMALDEMQMQNDAQNVREQVVQMLNQHAMQMKQVTDQLAAAGQPQAAQGVMDQGQLLMQQIAPLLQRLEKSISAPRKLVRDELGRASMSVLDAGETLQ